MRKLTAHALEFAAQEAQVARRFSTGYRDKARAEAELRRMDGNPIQIGVSLPMSFDEAADLLSSPIPKDLADRLKRNLAKAYEQSERLQSLRDAKRAQIEKMLPGLL